MNKIISQISASLVVLMCALMVQSCGNFSLYSGDDSPVVARVGEAELRESAFSDIYDGSLYAGDSLLQRKVMINNWVLSEVKTQAALEEIKNGGLNQRVIDKMVEEYRRTLLIHTLEYNYLSSTIDSVVTEPQIREYYAKNKEGFRLPGPLVKAVVVRLPEDLRQSKKLEQLFLKGDKEELSDFLNICAKNEYKVVDMRENWVEFSNVLRHIPFAYTDFDKFLSKHKRYEINDNEYKYMLRIEEYLPTGTLSPMEREKQNIIKILRNLRRASAIQTFNDSLVNTAKTKGLVTIE